MNNKDFNFVVKGRINKIKSLLLTKGKEHAAMNSDRLYNFKKGAEIREVSPESYAIDLFIKHYVWLLDAIKNADNPEFSTLYTEEQMNEHIGDLVNYLILIEALFKERYGRT